MNTGAQAHIFMPVGLLKDLLQTKPDNVPLLGLDVGKKTIGLALCDPAQSVATPLKTIKRKQFTKDIEALKQVIKDHEVQGFIVGYPVNMDGREGPRAQSVRDFAHEMMSTLDQETWIALWDERLSTVSVEGYVDSLVEKRKTKTNAKSSGLIDKLAAQVILQSALGYIQAQNQE